MDRYRCFDELRQREVEGSDYRIRFRHGVTDFAIMAPHGGKIERGTSPLAEAVAGDEHSFYSFEGIKDRNNHHLHITSDRFDEPRALEIAGQVQTVMTIHGAMGEEKSIYTGGLDRVLEERIIIALITTGFTVMHDPSPTRQGRGATNLCNLGNSGRGIQIELTQGLRKKIFDPINNGEYWMPIDLFHVLVKALRAVLAHDL
jgi:phage replication-related protein YjqB (UPF0714/DUF867 family)